MMETLDGEYQACKAFGGAYTREHFFSKYPETAAMVANLSDDDIWRLNRGGHDPHKVYAAYHAATHTEGMPTVILAKTVKGYGMGTAGESQNPTHQQKKLRPGGRASRSATASSIPIADDKLEARRSTCPTTTRARTRTKCSTCSSGARRSADSCRSAGASRQSFAARAGTGRLRADHQGQRRSRDHHHHGAGARHEPAAARQADRHRAWCRSSPTRRAPSAWRACSARSASTRRSDRSIRRRMPTSCCTTAKTRRARCCRKASAKPAGCRHGWPRQPAIRSATCRCCRSSSTTRCSASSASATWPGPRATCARADS